MVFLPLPRHEARDTARASETQGAGLARRIGRPSRERHVAHDRRHVEDSSIALTFHMRDETTAHQERAGEIGGDHAVPFLEGELRNILSNIDARIVDQDVYGTKALHYAALQVAHLLLVSNVGAVDIGIGAGVAGFFRNLIETCYIARD